MHCKHCGTRIDDDSIYCSSCGGKVDPVRPEQVKVEERPIASHNSAPMEAPRVSANTKSDFSRQDKGILLAFFTMAGMKILWFLSDVINTEEMFSQLYINAVLTPSSIVFWSTPVILALISKKREQRLILLIVGLLVFA